MPVSNKKAKKPQKKAVKVIKTNAGTRLKKLTRKQSKKQEKVTQRQAQLPNAWVLLGRSLRHLWRNKKLFAGILLVYAVLYILFVKGVSANFQLGSLRSSLDKTFSGKLSGFSSAVALYGLLLGSATTSSNQSGSIFQTFFVVIVSLALIWALRQTYSPNADAKKMKIKDSFYCSTYALIPFLSVLFIIFIQFIPALIVSSLYSIVKSNGVAVGIVQQAIALCILFLGLFWTFYMISGSLFAMYIVTLPNATPRASLKAAKKLVRYRRLIILRKVLLLPIVLLMFSAAVLIPLIILLPIAAELLFIVFTISLLAVIHSYFYTLYRSIL
jgi:hypothetical protein